MTDIKELIQDVALSAGMFLKKSINKSLDIQEKKNQFDLVSQIDKQSEEKIIEAIKQRFPDHDILGEESSGLNNKELLTSSRHLWIIDPLDGTTNFVHGLPGFTVSIAYLYDGILKAGAIYDPMLNELFFAEEGCGAYKNGEKITVSNTVLLHSALLGTGFPPDQDSRQSVVNGVNQLSGKTRSIRSLGSAALQLAYVACGRLDGYWEFGLNAWDVAAGVLLIREAGGMVSDFNNLDYHILLNDVAASNQTIHDEFLKHLK